jgi:hypothetical protein
MDIINFYPIIMTTIDIREKLPEKSQLYLSNHPHGEEYISVVDTAH